MILRFRKQKELFLLQIRAIFRFRVVLFFTILFPILFIGIFGFAFNTGLDPTTTTIKLAVVNLDSGIPEGNIFDISGQKITEKDYFTNQFFELLSSVNYTDEQTKIFSLNYYTDIDQARVNIEKRENKGLLVIPENFTKAVLAARRSILESQTQFDFTDFPDTNFTTTVLFEGDNSLFTFNTAAGVLSGLLNSFFYELPGNTSQAQKAGTSLSVRNNIASEGKSVFDFTVPGLVIFAIISNLSTVASALVVDLKHGQLERLKLTQMTGKDYIFSIVLSQLVFSTLQVPIMFGTAVLFGFSFDIKLLYGIVFGLIVSLSITGIAIIVASFVTQTTAANALSGIVGTPMAFLAGAFFEIPNIILIPKGTLLGDNSFGLFDLIPARPAITALRVLLLTDRGFTTILFEFWLTVILSLFYLTLGIVFYSRMHLRAKR